jgi:hypothetical protein
MKLAVCGANDKRVEEDQPASPDRAKETDDLKTAEKDCLNFLERSDRHESVQAVADFVPRILAVAALTAVICAVVSDPGRLGKIGASEGIRNRSKCPASFL